MADRSHCATTYQFGEFVLEPSQQRLTDGSRRPIALTPKAFDTLLYLVERSGELVTKNELLARVWPNVVVEEAILARNVADLRKALGDDSNAPRYIETLPKRGYRFVADVVVHAQEAGERGSAAQQSVRTVDTLQLVSESPAQRTNEATVEAPEFGRPSSRLRGVLLWLLGGFAVAAAAWWLTR